MSNSLAPTVRQSRLQSSLPALPTDIPSQSLAQIKRKPIVASEAYEPPTSMVEMMAAMRRDSATPTQFAVNVKAARQRFEEMQRLEDTPELTVTAQQDKPQVEIRRRRGLDSLGNPRPADLSFREHYEDVVNKNSVAYRASPNVTHHDIEHAAPRTRLASDSVSSGSSFQDSIVSDPGTIATTYTVPDEAFQKCVAETEFTTSDDSESEDNESEAEEEEADEMKLLNSFKQKWSKSGSSSRQTELTPGASPDLILPTSPESVDITSREDHLTPTLHGPVSSQPTFGDHDTVYEDETANDADHELSTAISNTMPSTLDGPPSTLDSEVDRHKGKLQAVLVYRQCVEDLPEARRPTLLPLTTLNFDCRRNHEDWTHDTNGRSCLPCRTCAFDDRGDRWVCKCCYLRVCTFCKLELQQKHQGNVQELLVNVEDRRMASGKMWRVELQEELADAFAQYTMNWHRQQARLLQQYRLAKSPQQYFRPGYGQQLLHPNHAYRRTAPSPSARKPTSPGLLLPLTSENLARIPQKRVKIDQKQILPARVPGGCPDSANLSDDKPPSSAQEFAQSPIHEKPWPAKDGKEERYPAMQAADFGTAEPAKLHQLLAMEQHQQHHGYH